MQATAKYISLTICSVASGPLLLMGMILCWLTICPHAFHEFELRVGAGTGNIELVSSLINQGADVHALDDQALMLAANKGFTNVVKLLLDHGADINARGGLAIYLAVKNDHITTVKLLFDRGASLSGCMATIAMKNGENDRRADDLVSLVKEHLPKRPSQCVRSSGSNNNSNARQEGPK